MIELPSTIYFDPKHWTAKHVKQSAWKVVVICEIEGEVTDYYSWFLRKRYSLCLNQPLRKAHVTIVNDRVRVGADNKPDKTQYYLAKQKWHGLQTTFRYDPENVRTDGKHWWVNVHNDEIATIREDCGFSSVPYFPIHMTIGYANEKHLAHSQYIHETILLANQGQ